MHTDGGDTLVRYLQDDAVELFTLSLQNVATGVTVDPQRWVLKEISSVSHVIDPGNGGDIDVYPNPAGDHINIYLPTAVGELVVEVLSTGGQRVAMQRLPMAPYRISVSSLPDGLYLLRIHNDGRVWIKKLVISR